MSRRVSEDGTPSGKRIGFAQSAKIGEQFGKLAIAHDRALDIGDGKREAGALQQMPEFAHIGEWGNAGRHAAKHLRLGCGEGKPELTKRLASEEGGDEQPVRFQSPANLYKRARQIVHRVQRQDADDEIEARIREGQGFLVGYDRGHLGRIAGAHPGAGQRLEDRKCRTARIHIESACEGPIDRVKSKRNLSRGFGCEKVVGIGPCSPFPVRPVRGAIEYSRRCICHIFR